MEDCMALGVMVDMAAAAKASCYMGGRLEMGIEELLLRGSR